jgi:hypothetical protein
MSHEGFTLVMRALLVAFLVVTGAIFKALVGPGRNRDLLMLAGTLGGVSLGVLVAGPIFHWIGTDVSALTAALGIPLGWTVSWRFADKIARRDIRSSSR